MEYGSRSPHQNTRSVCGWRYIIDSQPVIECSLGIGDSMQLVFYAKRRLKLGTTFFSPVNMHGTFGRLWRKIFTERDTQRIGHIFLVKLQLPGITV